MENPNLDMHECDWEVLVTPNSEEHLHHSSSFGGGAGGDNLLCSDYFSINNQATVTATTDDAAATPTSTTWADPSGSSVVIAAAQQQSYDTDSNSAEIVENNSVNDVELDEQLSGLNVENESQKKVAGVWWKVPLEVVKYCVWRVSPMWSISMAAAALMGFVLLRRRYLYRIKRKCQGLKINVAVDDNKVSQLMSRAARLNEAFSVVKRIPVIRPALPAPGMTSWPVMSLR